MSKIKSKRINWLGCFITYLFATKIFVWHDKLIEYDTLWSTFLHYFIFRDSFIIVFVLSLTLIATIIDDWNTPLKKLSERKRWVAYHIVTYTASTLLYIAHNRILNHFFQTPFETWQTLWLRWTVLYAFISVAFYIKYFMPKPKKKTKKTITTNQSIRLKTGEEAVVTEIFNDGKSYNVQIPQKDGSYNQSEISHNDIKSIFERIETPI
ncbi:MAG: hypothetical protein FWD97_02750 [Defluviitaleaceae bacterium]|nr:hypothetical protein [Defluviitaleaceae bacterium]